MGTQLATSMNTMPVLTGSAASLEAYIAAAHSIPILSPEKEHELAVRYQETGDIKAAEQLVLPHLRFVVKIANNYAGYGLALADLIQEGNIGLMKAVKRFDPAVGVRLVSFAVHWIKAEIHEFILKNWPEETPGLVQARRSAGRGGNPRRDAGKRAGDGKPSQQLRHGLRHQQ